MNVGFALGRIMLVVLFILSGAGKLLDIAGTAALIDSKFAFPAPLFDYWNQAAAAVSMPPSQLLAVVLGVIEFVAALLVAVNVLTRTAAVVLIIYTAVTVFLFYDFWNLQASPERTNLIAHALESLSIMGGLLMLASLPRRFWREEVIAPAELPPYEERRVIAG